MEEAQALKRMWERGRIAGEGELTEGEEFYAVRLIP
jgi:hypothetical protein